MKKMASVLSTIARRAGGRVRRLRRGSILILVVVLLVLLALIGTAYVSTARTDRQSSQNYVVNTQVTQMADGVVNMVIGTLVGDEFDLNDPSPSAFREAFSQNSSPNTYNPYTFAGTSASPAQTPVEYWLGDRIPILVGTTPTWGAISGPLSSLLTFESPDGAGPIPAANARFNVMPNAKNGYPALTLDRASVNTNAADNYIAADADGDGIADSMLFRIPGGYVNGLTYYAGVRIIDNNAAINVNTARSRESDGSANLPPPATFSITGLPNFGLFQSGIGLQEMLNPTQPTPSEMKNLDGYRFGDPTGYNWAYSTPYADSAQNYVYNPPLQRADASYITLGDAFYNGLIRRIGNPGINYVQNGNTYRFTPIPRSEGARLAANFCIMNPIGGSSLLETLMPSSLGVNSGASTSPFSPAQASLWFSKNFDYTNALGGGYFQNLRALAVTRNPNSNFISAKYDPSNVGDPLVTGATAGYVGAGMLPYGYTPSAGTWTPRNLAAVPPQPGVRYSAGDVVSYNGLNYVSLQSNNFNNAPNPNMPTAYWKRSVWRGMWTSSPSTPYALNDIVQSIADSGNGSGATYGAGMTFICVGVGAGNIAFDPGTLTPTAALAEGWKRQPWHPVPTKTNINTATFRDLWRAFWSVMSGPALNNNLINPVPASTPTPNETPFGTNGFAAVAGLDPYGAPLVPVGFTTSPYYDPYYVSPRNISSLLQNPALGPPPQHMFRSTLRDERYLTTTITGPTAQSVIRFDPENMMLLRSALAAVNTLAMRSSTQDVISRTITLNACVDPGAPSAPSGNPAVLTPVQVSVFSASPQLYITEVYANSDESSTDPNANVMGGPFTNPNGYVAIELYNPSNSQITVSKWQLGLLDRRNAGTYPNMAVTPITAAPITGLVIPGHGYLVLENYPENGAPNGTDAQYRPSSAFPTLARARLESVLTNTTEQYVPNLYQVLSGNGSNGGELVVLKPRSANINIGPAKPNPFDPDNQYDETGSNLYALNDYVPVDSFDFTGLSQEVTTTIPQTFSYCHYVRTSDNPTNTNTATHYGFWRCVYPGRYDGVQTSPGSSPRQEGTEFNTGAVVGVVPTLIPPTMFGNPALCTYFNVFCPIRVGDFNMPGPNPVNAGVNKFPFGGFARNGDMLQVPYIGAYTVRMAGAPAGTILEMNSLPMDVSFADDGDSYNTNISNDAAENIGRFCPISWATGLPDATSTNSAIIDSNYRNESSTMNTPATAFENWTLSIVSNNAIMAQSIVTSYAPTTHTFNLATPLTSLPIGSGTCYIVSPTPSEADTTYKPWVGALFSYLTVQDPSDDYTPNTDPGPYSQSPGQANYAYPPADSNAAFQPAPVFNDDYTAMDQTHEHTVGVDGKININTASAKVLSALPFVPDDPGSVDENIAQAIVVYRNSNGPFTSIMDLLNVPVLSALRNTTGAEGYQSLPNPPTLSDGNLTTGDLNFPSLSSAPYIPWNTLVPVATGVGAPLGDFQTQFLVLDRISNLVTVQSDSYTVYIVVEGWLNAGTANAQLVNTHRVAFQVDRNGVTPTNRLVRTTSVPEN